MRRREMFLGFAARIKILLFNSLISLLVNQATKTDAPP